MTEESTSVELNFCSTGRVLGRILCLGGSGKRSVVGEPTESGVEYKRVGIERMSGIWQALSVLAGVYLDSLSRAVRTDLSVV